MQYLNQMQSPKCSEDPDRFADSAQPSMRFTLNNVPMRLRMNFTSNKSMHRRIISPKQYLALYLA